MSDLKTQPTKASVTDFLDAVPDERKRTDSYILLRMMQELTHAEPIMWGSSIVGFGSYHYKSSSGREGDWLLTGFSPRKQALSIYIMSGFAPFAKEMDTLGSYKTGVGCLYVKRLADIDMLVLKQLVSSSIDYMKTHYTVTV